MTSTLTTPSQDEIFRAGVEALRRELGVVGMVRFLQQLSPVSGDYTAERAQLLGNRSVDELVDAIERRRAAEQAKQDPHS